MLSSAIAIVDATPLMAVLDADDADHRRCLTVLDRSDLQLVIPALVVAEVCYLAERRLGPAAEATFVRGLSRFEVQAPQTEDWDRIADLVERYANFPLGGTDASIIALAERLGTDVLITLDRRHFAAVRPRHVPFFRLLPE